MISMAAHIVFVWVLSLTMQAKTVKVEAPAPKPEIREEMKKEEALPAVPVKPEAPPPVTKPIL